MLIAFIKSRVNITVIICLRIRIFLSWITVIAFYMFFKVIWIVRGKIMQI